MGKRINAGLTKKTKTGRYGSIDQIIQNGVRGWFVDLDAKHVSQRIELLINGKLVGEGITNLYRADISELVGNELSYGFNLFWEDDLIRNVISELGQDDKTVQIVVRVIESGALIPFRKNVSAKELKSIIRLKPETPRNELINHGLDYSPEPNSSDVKVIAFYLPQFHPFSENDKFWGKGFTEWTNIAKNKKRFREHQPINSHGEMGFYDLRVDEVRADQIKIAQHYGIYGFCYYYYQFGDRVIMDTPLRAMLDSPGNNMPFCICWANESWTRRWDGSENEVLIEQPELEPGDNSLPIQITEIVSDNRYIRVNDKPLIVIYRSDIIGQVQEVLAGWRQYFRDVGVGEVHFCMAETFGQKNPYELGFDSSLVFPPHGLEAPLKTELFVDKSDNFEGQVFDYRDVVYRKLENVYPSYTRFPGVMVGWDNTARRGSKGNVFVKSDPHEYEIWLRSQFEIAAKTLKKGSRFVFVNAWNEWAEGAVLEPGQHHGRGYLEATKRVVEERMDPETIERYLSDGGELSAKEVINMINSMRKTIRENIFLRANSAQHGLPKDHHKFKPGIPHWLENGFTFQGMGSVTQVNHQTDNRLTYQIENSHFALMKGWSDPIVKSEYISDNRFQFNLFDASYFCLLRRDSSVAYHAFVGPRHSISDAEDAEKVGFNSMVDFGAVESGFYGLAIAYRGVPKNGSYINIVHDLGVVLDVY
jgi:hypothetical protein